MNRTKKLCVLLAVLAAVCAAAVIVATTEQKREQVRSEGITALSVDGDSVTALSWEYADNSFAFHRDDDGVWRYDADDAFPVNQTEIETLLAVFADFRTDFTIEDADDMSRYGLKEPTASIHLETKEESWDVLIGDESQMDAQRYVSIGDGNVYLASADPLESYSVLLAGLIQHDEMPVLGEVRSIEFSGDVSYTVSYETGTGKSYDEDDVYFTTLNGSTLPLDSSRVSSYLDTLTSLNLTDFVTYSADETNLDTYGLDQPELVIAVDYTETDSEGNASEETFTLSVSREPDQKGDAPDESDPDSIIAYVRAGDSSLVYQISGSEYLSLMSCTKNDLRHQELLWAAFTDITKADISLDGKDYTFTVESEKDEHVWYYGEEKLSIGDFQSALTGLTAADFTTVQPDGKEEIRLTVYLGNASVSSVEIALYRYDGNACLAAVDGTPTAFVSRADAMALVEAVNAIVLSASAS